MTTIEWTQGDDGSPGKTWNPTRGCRRVDAACERCYAEADAHRRNLMQRALGREEPYGGLLHITPKGDVRWNGRGRFVPAKLVEPLTWRKPTRVFVDSMSDLFFEAFSFEEIAAVFGIMDAAFQHTFIVLTKRPGRALEFFEWLARAGDPRGELRRRAFEETRAAGEITPRREAAILTLQPPPFGGFPSPNVIIGVSVGTRNGLQRIDRLREIPAAHRVVSFEPLLESLVPLDLRGIDWAIIGGESGRDPRSMDITWAREIVAAARAAGCAPFVKQLGLRPVLGGTRVRVSPPKGGDIEEWPLDLRVREFPEVRRA